MAIFDFLRSKPEKPSKEIARDRLQVLVALERSRASSPGWMPEMQQRILDVIKDYVDVPDNALNIDIRNDEDKADEGNAVSVLEINIDCPLK